MARAPKLEPPVEGEHRVFVRRLDEDGAYVGNIGVVGYNVVIVIPFQVPAAAAVIAAHFAGEELGVSYSEPET